MRRLAVAAAFGALGATLAYQYQTATFYPGGDFSFAWTAARLLGTGANPYHLVPFLNPPPAVLQHGVNLWYYPHFAAFAGLPFAWLPVQLAGPAFAALSAALLAYALYPPQRRHLLLLFASAPAWMALVGSQWSPYFAAAAFLPVLGPVLAVKPTVGLAVWLYRPNRWTVAGGAILAGISLILLPSWPLDWWRTLSAGQSGYPIPAAILPFGPLLLLALLRWREPEARVLLALSVLPHYLGPYDQLPLFLVCRTPRQAFALAVASWAGLLSSLFLPTAGRLLLSAFVLLPYLVALSFLAPFGSPATAFQLRASAARAGMSPPVQPQ